MLTLIETKNIEVFFALYKDSSECLHDHVYKLKTKWFIAIFVETLLFITLYMVLSGGMRRGGDESEQ